MKSWDELAVGDIIIDSENYEWHVVGIYGDIVFMRDNDDIKYTCIYMKLKDSLKCSDCKIKQPELKKVKT